jgi:hypothetical protein
MGLLSLGKGPLLFLVSMTGDIPEAITASIMIAGGRREAAPREVVSTWSA